MICKKCGKQIDDKAVVCVHCGTATPAAKPKQPFYKKWWFWLIAVIVVIAVIGSAGGSETPNPTDPGATISSSSAETTKQTEAPEEIIEISAAELFAAYDENEVAADNKYKGKKLKITGTVEDIGKDILDDTYITLDCGELIFSIQCYFANDQLSAVAELKKGDTITLIGVCKGETGNVIIKNCEIQ